MKRTLLTLSAVALLAGATTAACSSGGSTPAASGSAVGGPSVCDNATITKAVQDQLDAAGESAKVFDLGTLTCKDGWAVVHPTIGTAEDNAVTEVEVFQAEGQFWIPKDRAVACGTQNPDDLASYPSDAEIPQSLYIEGCTTD